MKALVTHLLRNNLEEIQNRSYLDFEVEGLHFINLLDSPGKSIHLLIAEKGCKLRYNYPTALENGLPMVKGLTCRFADTTICLHCGKLTNWEAVEVEHRGIEVDKWYQINGTPGHINYTRLGISRIIISNEEALKPGIPFYLPGDSMQSWFIPDDEIVAWFEFEGKRAEDYIPFTYTNDDLSEDNKFRKLFRRPSGQDIENLLKMVGLIEGFSNQ